MLYIITLAALVATLPVTMHTMEAALTIALVSMDLDLTGVRTEEEGREEEGHEEEQ